MLKKRAVEEIFQPQYGMRGTGGMGGTGGTREQVSRRARGRAANHFI